MYRKNKVKYVHFYHRQAFKKGKKERPPFLPALPEEKREDVSVPSELTCLLCKDLLTDAVVIPCCGNSYCDECKCILLKIYEFDLTVDI